MSKKIDLRIMKTHEKLREALADMMSEMTFDEITVFDLCAKAQIRRATFYKHFNDKYDFLSYIVRLVQDSLAEKVSASFDLSTPVEYLSCYVKQIIEYFDSRDKILTNIFGSSTYASMYNIITDGTYFSLVENLQAAVEKGFILPCDVEFAARFINGGLAYLLVDFLKHRRITEDELLSKCKQILEKIFN